MISDLLRHVFVLLTLASACLEVVRGMVVAHTAAAFVAPTSSMSRFGEGVQHMFVSIGPMDDPRQRNQGFSFEKFNEPIWNNILRIFSSVEPSPNTRISLDVLGKDMSPVQARPMPVGFMDFDPRASAMAAYRSRRAKRFFKP